MPNGWSARLLLSPCRSPCSEKVITALHRGNEPSHHSLGRAGPGDGPDVADIAAAPGGEQCQSDQGRETGAAVRIGKAGNLLRAPDADCAAEDALHVIGDVLELRASAGEHDLAANGAREAERFQRRLDLVGQL